MNTQRSSLIIALLAILMMIPSNLMASGKEEGVNVKEVIFHHLGDGYGWEVMPFSHVYRIPLPVIVRAEDGKWFCFSSSRLTKIEEVADHKTGKMIHEAVPQIVDIEKDGQTYQFLLAHVSSHSNKVVQIFPLSSEEESNVKSIAAGMVAQEGGEPDEKVVDGYVGYNGTYYREFKPLDISITKNVLALFLTAIVVTAMVMSVVRWYARKGLKA